MSTDLLAVLANALEHKLEQDHTFAWACELSKSSTKHWDAVKPAGKLYCSIMQLIDKIDNGHQCMASGTCCAQSVAKGIRCPECMVTWHHSGAQMALHAIASMSYLHL